LAELISKFVGFKGSITYNKNKPNGQPRRLLNIEKAKEEFGFRSKIPFEIGLKRAIRWYLNEIK